MATMRARRFFGAIALGAIAVPVAASPPPPPPSFIDTIASELLPTPTSESFERYAALLADDLVVTLNGTEIAPNKAGWLAIQRRRLGKVDRSVYGYAEGRDNVVIFERVDDRSDEHCPPGHGCFFDPRDHTRAVRYEIGPDHLVHAIRIIESEGFLRTRF
jgi:hypothetical protein